MVVAKPLLGTSTHSLPACRFLWVIILFSVQNNQLFVWNAFICGRQAGSLRAQEDLQLKPCFYLMSEVGRRKDRCCKIDIILMFVFKSYRIVLYYVLIITTQLSVVIVTPHMRCTAVINGDYVSARKEKSCDCQQGTRKRWCTLTLHEVWDHWTWAKQNKLN